MAIAYAQQAAQPGPNLLQQYFEQGQKAIVENRYAEASQAFEKALELGPDIAEIHATLGFSYFQQGRYREAIPVLQNALRMKPGLPTFKWCKTS